MLYGSQTWATRKEDIKRLEAWRRMKKISWTEHNNKLRSAGNDWRRKSPDADTKKETKDMEPRKRPRRLSGHRLLFLHLFLL